MKLNIEVVYNKELLRTEFTIFLSRPYKQTAFYLTDESLKDGLYLTNASKHFILKCIELAKSDTQ